MALRAALRSRRTLEGIPIPHFSGDSAGAPRMKGKHLRPSLAHASWLASWARDLGFDAWDSFSREDFSKLYRMVRPYTMCGNARLRGLYNAVRYVIDRNIAGDLVECGAARGGSAALMGLAIRLDATRKLWVFDTFEGLPPPTDADPDFEIAEQYTGDCRGDLVEVSALFERLGIYSQSRLIKGLFQDTLAESGVQKIAVLHIDCDWYESTITCLNHFYDRVSPGGVIQIDDYGTWAGAQKAVDEFLCKRSIKTDLRRLDCTGRQLIKAGIVR